MAEFDGARAKLYREVLLEFPNARKGDFDLMKKYLSPQSGEVIVEIGAGNGTFSGTIADILLPNGHLYVLDPSLEQLAGVKELNRKNIKIVNQEAEKIDLEQNFIDAIWSFGAVHHINNKQEAFKKFDKVLKKDGRLIIGDVFQGSALAKHFDERVSKYCITGHSVTFLTRDSAKELCRFNGFTEPQFYDFNAQWQFNSKKDIGLFLCKLHAMTKTTPEECLLGAEEILGIAEEDNTFYLNWPMTMVITSKK